MAITPSVKKPTAKWAIGEILMTTGAGDAEAEEGLTWSSSQSSADR
jgi:hypothetical protein